MRSDQNANAQNFVCSIFEDYVHHMERDEESCLVAHGWKNRDSKHCVQFLLYISQMEDDMRAQLSEHRISLKIIARHSKNATGLAGHDNWFSTL